MAGLVVEPLVPPQQLQQGDGAGGEQAVGADDDQQHRQKIKGDGGGGVVGGDGDGVARPQGGHPNGSGEPPGTGLLFPHLSAPEQLDGVGQPHPPQVDDQGQHQQSTEQRGGESHGRQGESGGERNGKPEQAGEQGGGQGMENHTAHHAAHNADEGGIQALPALEQGDISLAHAKDVVKAQFLFPLLHEKTVDIQQQDGGENTGDEHAHAHHHRYILCPPHGIHPRIKH